MERHENRHGVSSFLLAATLLAVLLPMTAFAEEASQAEGAEKEAIEVYARVKAYEDVVDDHRRDGADEAVVKDIREAVKLFGEAEKAKDKEKAQERLVKIVGLTCSRMRSDDVRKTALVALGEMGHEDGARYVRRFLEPLDEGDEVPPTLLPAIEAAACIGDHSLVRYLLKIVDDSENYLVAAKAAEALGKFRDVDFRYHKKILEELGKTLIKDMPGSPSRGKGDPTTGAYIPGKQGDAGTARWSLLSVAIPKALNELTGQQFGTMGDWMAMIDEHERNLKILFVDRYRDD